MLVIGWGGYVVSRSDEALFDGLASEAIPSDVLLANVNDKVGF